MPTAFDNFFYLRNPLEEGKTDAEFPTEINEAMNIEPMLCVNAILELLAEVTNDTELNGRKSRILDLSAGKGQIGEMLS